MPTAQSHVGSSAIPSKVFLRELCDDELRNEFVADKVRTRFALLIRSLREQRGWSQAELGRRMGKPQSVISRLEDPDYGKLSMQTVFEVAAAFGLPVYIDMPEWEEWFRLIDDMSEASLKRRKYDADRLAAPTQETSALAMPDTLFIVTIPSKTPLDNPPAAAKAPTTTYAGTTASAAMSFGSFLLETTIRPPRGDLEIIESREIAATPRGKKLYGRMMAPTKSAMERSNAF